MFQSLKPPTQRVGEVPLDLLNHGVDMSVSENGGAKGEDSPQVDTKMDIVDSQEPDVQVIPDEVYDKYTPRRKAVMVALLSYCAFLPSISSTSTLSATPEIAAEFHTTGPIINVSSALYILMMGLSPMVWGPLSQVFGRRIVCDAQFDLYACEPC